MSDRIPTGTPGSRARSSSASAWTRSSRVDEPAREEASIDRETSATTNTSGVGALVDRLRRLDDRLHRREPEHARHGGEGGRKGNERAQGRLVEAEARPHPARPSLTEDEHGHRRDQRHREHGAERCQEADIHGQ